MRLERDGTESEQRSANEDRQAPDAQKVDRGGEHRPGRGERRRGQDSTFSHDLRRGACKTFAVVSPSTMRDAPAVTRAHDRVLRAAILLAWGLPFVAMTIIGFSQQGEAILRVSRESLVTLAEVTAVFGLAFGVAGLRGTAGNPGSGSLRRRALLGTAGSVVILLVTQVGGIAGALSGKRAEAELAAALAAATHEHPGWNGGARLQNGATLYAVEIDNGSAFAKMALAQYRRPYRIVLFGVDNRDGTSALVLDLGGARAIQEGGPGERAVLHPETREPEEGSILPRLMRPTTLRVARGESYEDVLVLFPPEQSFREVRWIEVQINGAPSLIRGRFFTREEKRAIDAKRHSARSP